MVGNAQTWGNLGRCLMSPTASGHQFPPAPASAGIPGWTGSAGPPRRATPAVQLTHKRSPAAVVKRPGKPSLILAPASFRMDVYSARDGEAEWWVRGLPSEMKCVPIIVGDLVYIAGFNTPENDPGKQIALPAWRLTRMSGEKASSPGLRRT